MKIWIIKLLVLTSFYLRVISQVSKRHTYIKYNKSDITLTPPADSHELEVAYSTTKYLDDRTMQNFPTLDLFIWRYSTLKQFDSVEHEPLYNGCKSEFTAYPLFMIDLETGLINNYWNKFYVAWMPKLPAPSCISNIFSFTYKIRFFNTLEFANNFYSQLDGNPVFKAANNILVVNQTGRLNGDSTFFDILSSNISPC